MTSHAAPPARQAISSIDLPGKWGQGVRPINHLHRIYGTTPRRCVHDLPLTAAVRRHDAALTRALKLAAGFAATWFAAALVMGAH